MSESTTVQDVQEEKVVTFQPSANPFDDTSWADKKETPEIKQEEPKGEVKQEPVIPPQEEKKEEFIDADEWLKQNYGWENADAGKKELEELRKLREAAQTPAELKFANEQSEKFFAALKEGKEDEVYNYLNRKRELSQVDKLKAEEIIRLNIKYTNPHFKDADISDVFEEQYAKPAKPVQQELEEDGDFEVRLQVWQQQIDKIDRKIERDSFAAKQDLSKYNSELVLPDIPKTEPPSQEPQIDPKALEDFNAYKGKVHHKLDSDITSFDGFNVTYKDEAVEIPIAFNVSEDDKKSLIQFIKNEVLGESFNVNDFFAKRWFDEQGNPKPQIFSDGLFFTNGEKVLQKMVNESAAKRLEHKMKADSNIVINPAAPQGTFAPDNRPEPQKLQEFFWNQ